MTGPMVPFDEAAWRRFMCDERVTVRPIGISFFNRHPGLINSD